jgi:hypothetical protein
MSEHAWGLSNRSGVKKRRLTQHGSVAHACWWVPALAAVVAGLLSVVVVAVANVSVPGAIVLMASPLALVAFWWFAERVRNERWSSVSSRIMFVGIAATLPVAAGIVYTSSAQVFAVSGLVKYILLPFLYSVALAALLIRADNVSRTSLPVFIWVLSGGGFISLAVPIITDGSGANFNALLQGLALVGGFVLLFLVGRRVGNSSDADSMKFFYLLAIWGLIGVALGRSISPFTYVIAPAAAVFLVLLVKRVVRGTGHVILVITLILAVAASQLLSERASVSSAAIGQIAICLLLFIAANVGAIVRAALLVVGIVVGVVQLAGSDVLRISLGIYQGISDVPLAQRGYETRVVLDNISRNTFTTLFGLGPGATIDLTWAPDASTLANSGRNLTQVDDVHLLTTWFLLKFGMIGLVCLMAIAGFVALAALRIFNAKNTDWVAYSALIFVLATLVLALTAATNLMTNPAFALFLGVLSARVGHPRPMAQQTQPLILPSPLVPHRSSSRSQRTLG